jgi:hypothetical protein
MIDEIDLILAIARKAGLSWRTASDIGASRARRIMNDVPIYCIERELALRLEDQRRLISENDFRDMQAFCAVVPYADDVIAENQFVNLAMQAKLGARYGTRISTHLTTLEKAEPKKLASWRRAAMRFMG